MSVIFDTVSAYSSFDLSSFQSGSPRNASHACSRAAKSGWKAQRTSHDNRLIRFEKGNTEKMPPPPFSRQLPFGIEQRCPERGFLVSALRLLDESLYGHVAQTWKEPCV